MRPVPEHRAGKGPQSVQQLYLVGWSADRKSVHLSRRPGQPAEFVLDVDGELGSLRSRSDDVSASAESGSGSAPSAVNKAQAGSPGTGSSRSPCRLSPREIQARLRNGLTVAEVAVEAGVDAEWIDRFAPPILAEKASALQRACALTLTSDRKGVSAAPLGVALARNLEERGIRPLPGFEAWSAHLHHDKTWVVRYSYRSRGRNLEVEWLADLAAGELGARNRLASDLGWLDPDLDSPRADPTGAGPESTSASRTPSQPAPAPTYGARRRPLPDAPPR